MERITTKIFKYRCPDCIGYTGYLHQKYYEIIGAYGAGYLDSGTGIVFFMLIGPLVPRQTYDSFSFDRDYRSYFLLGVTVVKDGIVNIPVTQLQKGNHIIIRNEEMIPVILVLTGGKCKCGL